MFDFLDEKSVVVEFDLEFYEKGIYFIVFYVIMNLKVIFLIV